MAAIPLRTLELEAGDHLTDLEAFTAVRDFNTGLHETLDVLGLN